MVGRGGCVRCVCWGNMVGSSFFRGPRLPPPSYYPGLLPLELRSSSFCLTFSYLTSLATSSTVTAFDLGITKSMINH